MTTTEQAGWGGAPWRVFLSHTSELRDFPRAASYVTAAERAVSAAGHAILDMADFPASELTPSRLCTQRVQSSDVYIAIIGTRYGSTVPDRPDRSYTELEFEAAGEAGIPRLVFLLDTEAEGLGLPPSALIDRHHGDRQHAFRQRLLASGITVQMIRSPDQLGQLLERSLHALAASWRRADVPPGGSVRPPLPLPVVPPRWFQGRRREEERLRDFLEDPALRLAAVVGRGGLGKTTLVCRALQTCAVEAVLCLGPAGAGALEVPDLFEGLCRLLPSSQSEQLRAPYRDHEGGVDAWFPPLLAAFRRGTVVVLLDQLETVIDPVRERLRDEELEQTLELLLRAPPHAVKLILTSRVPPVPLLRTEPGRQRILRLEQGLDRQDTARVLAALDPDERLGVGAGGEPLLEAIWQRTRGYPRALETFQAILATDLTLTPRDLLEQTGLEPQEDIVASLAGEAFERLDPAARQVIAALAVLPRPEPVEAVGRLLRSPAEDHPDPVAVLRRLVNRQLVSIRNGLHWLHPTDRTCVLAHLRRSPAAEPGGHLDLRTLRERSADYYRQIRCPPQEWRSLQDLAPQLAEFDLLCELEDFDAAAAVLATIDFDALLPWGHLQLVQRLHERLRGSIADPLLAKDHCNVLGICRRLLGDNDGALAAHQEALTIARRLGDATAEAAQLGNQALCHEQRGDLAAAAGCHEQALAIAQRLGDRWMETACLGNLGVLRQRQGALTEARRLHGKALALARRQGDRRQVANQLGNLGLCLAAEGQPRLALPELQRALALARELGDRGGEAHHLLNLAQALRALGRDEEARSRVSAAREIAEAIGDRALLEEARAAFRAEQSTQSKADGASRAHAAEGIRDPGATPGRGGRGADGSGCRGGC
jgi:tetratricopeptide (TPR) repeat protein